MTSPAPGDRNISRNNSAVRQLYAGGSNNRGTVTLNANATTTIVKHESVNPNSHISLMPLTDSALKAMVRAIGPKNLPLSRLLNAASGNVSYTGLGFKPSLIQFIAGIIGTSGFGSVGFADAVNASCVEISGTAGLNGLLFQATFPIIIRADSSDYQLASVVSFDADGFTLSWSKVGAPALITASVLATCYPDTSVTGLTGVRVSNRTTGSFTLTHASNPAVDQNFTFSATGGSL